MRQEEPPVSGTRILKNRFRLLSQLAKGGMGVTYRAWDEQSGRPAVVKMPKQALFDEPGFLERFDREVRATAGLDHPFIVKVVDHGVDAGEPFLAMQFLPGGSLASRIALHAEPGRGRLPMAQLHAWLPRIAAALDHAHAGGVIHRDVKPANIFFDAQGLACLGDFGIAKIIEDSAADAGDPTLTGTHMTLGTGAYMAPERLKSRSAIDGRADQYALAICVFEALAGDKPFRSTTEYIFVEQATQPPPDLAKLRPDITAACCRAVNKALAKRPDGRFPTCSEFAEAVLEGVPEPEPDTAFAWLECPACRNLIRLPQAAAGREGRCPRCKAALVIAHDLEGLWLPDEYGPAAAVAAPLVSVAPEPRPQPQPWRPTTPRSWAALAALGIAALLVPWLWPEPPAPPRPVPVPGPGPIEPVVGNDVPPEPLATPSIESPRSVEPQQPEPGPAQVAAPSEPPATPSLPPPPPPATPPPAEIPEAKVELETEWAAKRDAAKKHFDEVVRWVKVADPGNQPDPLTGRGAVAEPFYLAQYELTNADYCVFLNASRAGIDMDAGIGDRAIAPNGSVPGISRQSLGLGQGFQYTPEPNMAEKPAVLTAPDAVALANWLHNIHRTGSDDFTGGAYSSLKGPFDRATDALVFIPTIDEWAKAAYFKGGKPTSGYHAYPTATSEDLAPVSGLMPEGRPSLRGVETAANFGGRAAWNGAPRGGNPTDVGQNGAPSEYGAFDMGGNVAEWAIAGREAAACGGDFRSALKSLARKSLKSIDSTDQPQDQLVTGLRLARPVTPATAKLRADVYKRLEKQDAFRSFAEITKEMAPTVTTLKAMPDAQNFERAVQRSFRAVNDASQNLSKLKNRWAAQNAPVDGEIEALVPRLQHQLDKAKAILGPALNQPKADPIVTAAMQLLGAPNPRAQLEMQLAPVSGGVENDVNGTHRMLLERYGRP